MLIGLLTIGWVLADGTDAGGGPLNYPMLVGIGLIALSMITIRLQRRKTTRAPGMQDYLREHDSRLRQQNLVKDDMESLLVQLSELARQLNGQMDTRYAKLEQTLADADRKIATLEALLHKAGGIPTVDVTIDDKPATPQAITPPLPPAPAAQPELPASAPKPATAPAPGRSSRSRKAARQARKEAEPPKPSKASDAPKPSAPTPSIDPRRSIDPRHSRVYDLADQGQTPVEIARQTNQTTGEVELILNLRRTQAN